MKWFCSHKWEILNDKKHCVDIVCNKCNRLEIIEKKEQKYQKEFKRSKTNYPDGSKIIVKSNNDEPYKIGTLLRWEINYNYSRNPNGVFPIVQFDGDDTTYFCMGIIRHHCEERINILDKLTNTEQWNILSEFHILRDKDE